MMWKRKKRMKVGHEESIRNFIDLGVEKKKEETEDRIIIFL